MQATLHDTTLRLAFDGDLLSTNVNALRAKLLAQLDAHPSAKVLVADLGNTRVVDSQGLNLLIALSRETDRRKLGYRVENAVPDVRRLFTLLNLNERLGLPASAQP